MAKSYGVQVYSPTRRLPVRTQGQLANAGTSSAILNPRSPSMARPRTQSFGGGGAVAPQGTPQSINVPQVGQMQGNPTGYGQSFGPTPLDLMRANRPAPVQQPNAFSGGFFDDVKGALGVAANTMPGKVVLGALNVMDMPRRAVISGIHEISDAIGSGDASWDDWKTQFNDPSYGVGKYVDTGNWVLDDILGFGGDVLLDPMTYVAGSSVLAGVGRSTRLEAAAAATAAGFSDDVVNQIGRRGVGFLDNAQRLALREATNTAGERIGVNVLDRGYYLRLPKMDPMRIPGTGTLDRAIASPFSRARSALAQSNLGSYLRSRAIDPLDQTEAIERLITGRGTMSASEAGERLNMTAGYRAGRGTTRTTMRDGAASLIRSTPGGNEELNVMLDAAERVGNTPINEYFESGAKLFEAADGVYARGQRERYVPHIASQGAEEWMDSSSQAAREFKAGIIPTSKAEAVSSSTLERELIAGREYQFGGRQVKNATTGELEWVGGRKMKVTDGTIKGLNDAFAEAFPETKGKFKLFEDDFQRIAAHYSETLAEDVGRLTGYQRLARSRSGLVKAIDDVSDWKINQKETALRYGEVSKALKTELKAKSDTVAQLRAAAKQKVFGIQGVMGVHMHNALDQLNTVAEPVRAELTDLLADAQRIEKLVGGTTGVKGGAPEPGILEQRLNEELGRIQDRADALDSQISAIAPQAQREREAYLAAQRGTRDASLANASRNTPTYDEWQRLIHERAAVSMDSEALDTVRNQLRNTRTKVAKISENIENESFLNLVAGPQDRLPAVAEGEVRREVIPANFDPATGKMLSPEKGRRLIAREMTDEEARIAGITPTRRSPSQVRIHFNEQRRSLLRHTGIGHSDEIDAATVRLGTQEAARDKLAATQGKIIAQAREEWTQARSEVAALRQQRSEIQGEVSNWADVAELDRKIAEATADDGRLGRATTAYAEAKRDLDAANQKVQATQKEINDLRNRQLAEARGKDEAMQRRVAEAQTRANYRAQRRPEAPSPDAARELEQLTQGMGRKSYDNATRQLEAKNKSIAALDQSIEMGQRTLDSDNFGKGFKAGQRENIEAGLADKKRWRAEQAAEAQGWQDKIDAHDARVAELSASPHQAEIDRLTAQRDRIVGRRRAFRNPELDRAEVNRLQGEIERLQLGGPRELPEEVALRPPPEQLPLNPAQVSDAERKLGALRSEHAAWAQSEDAGHIARAQRDLTRTNERLTSLDRQRKPLVHSSNRVRIDGDGNYIDINPNAVSQELMESRDGWQSLRRIAQTERDQAQAMIYKADRGLLPDDEALESVQRFMRADDDLNALDRQVDAANATLRDEAFRDAPPAISGQGDKLRQVDEEAAMLRRAQRQLDRFETLTGRKARQRANQMEVLSSQLAEQQNAARRIFEAATEGNPVQTWEQRVRQINSAEDSALAKSYTTGKRIKTEWEALEAIKGEGMRAFPQGESPMGRTGLLSEADRVELEDAYSVARNTPRKQRTRQNVAYQDAIETIRELEGNPAGKRTLVDAAERTLRSAPRDSAEYRAAQSLVESAARESRSGISNHEAAAISEWTAVKRRIDAASGGYDPSPSLTQAMKGKRGGVGDTTLAGRAKNILDSADLLTDEKVDRLLTSGAALSDDVSDFYDTMNRLSETLDEYQRRPTPANHADIDYLVQRGATQLGVFNSYGLALDMGIEPSDELGAFLLRNEVHNQLRVVKAQLDKTERNIATGAEAKAWGEWDAKIAAEDDIIREARQFIADQKEIKRTTGAYSDPQAVGNAKKRITGASSRKARLRAKPPRDFNEYADALDMLFDGVSKEVGDLSQAVNDYNLMRRLPKEVQKPAELLDRLNSQLDYDAANLVEVRAENARLRSAIIKAISTGKDTVRYSPSETARETFFAGELRDAIAEGKLDPATSTYAEYLLRKEEAAQQKALSLPSEEMPRKNAAITPEASAVSTYQTEPITNAPLLRAALDEATKANDQSAMDFLQKELENATQIDWQRAREVSPGTPASQRAPRGGPIQPSEAEVELRSQLTQLETKRRMFGINQEETETLRRTRSKLERFDRERAHREAEAVRTVPTKTREPQPIVVGRKVKGKITELSLEDAQQKLTFSSNRLAEKTEKLHADHELRKMLNGEGQRELDELTTKIETATLAGEMPDPADVARQSRLTQELENFQAVTFGSKEHIADAMDGGIRMLRDLADGTRTIQPSDLPVLRDLFGGMFQAEVAATYIERFNNLIERFAVVGNERRGVRSLGDLQQDFNGLLEEIRMTLGDNALTDGVETDVRELMKSRMDDAMREAGDASFEDVGLEDWAGEGIADSAEQVGTSGAMGPQTPIARAPTDVIGEMRDRLFGALVASRNEQMRAAQENAMSQAQLLGIVTGSMDATSVSKLGYTMSKDEFDRGALRDLLRQRFADMGLDPRNALPERMRAQRARYAQLSMMDKFLGGSVTTARMRDPEAFFIALSQLEQNGGSMADQLKLFDRFNVPEGVAAADAEQITRLRQDLKDAIKAGDDDRINATRDAIDQWEGRAPDGTKKAKGATPAKPKIDERARHEAQTRINKADEALAKIDEHMTNWHGETLQDVIANSPRPPKGLTDQYTTADQLLANRQSVELGRIADEVGTKEARQAARDARRRALGMAESHWEGEPQEFIDRALAISDSMKGIPEFGGTLAERRAALVAEREAAQGALSTAEGVERKAAAAAGRTLNDTELAQEFADATSEFNARLEALGDLSSASAEDLAQLNEMGDRVTTLARQRDENILKAKRAGTQGNDLYQQYAANREAVEGLRGKSDVTIDWRELMRSGLPNQSTIRGLAHKQAEGLGRRGPEGYVLGSLLGDRATPEARGYLSGHFAIQEARAAGDRAPINRAQQKLLGQRSAAEAALPGLEARESRLADIVGDQPGREARIGQLEAEDAARVQGELGTQREAYMAAQRQHAADARTFHDARNNVALERQRVQDRYTQNLTEMKMQLGDARKRITVARDSLTALDDMTATTQRAAAAAGNTSKELKPMLDDLNTVNQLRRDQVLLDTGADLGPNRRIPGRGPEGPAMIDVPEQVAMRQTEALLNSAMDAVIELGDQELSEKLLKDRVDQFAKGAGDVAPVLERVVHDGWVQMAEGLRGDANSLGVATGLADAIKNLSEALRQPESWKLIDQYTNFFKTYATMTPGFHVRNAMSAIFMNYVDGVRATHMVRAMPLWREFTENPLRFMESLAERPNGEKLRAAFQAVLGSGAGGQFVEAGVGEAGSMTSAAYQRLMHNRLTKFNTKVGSYVEGTARLGMALDTIERGGSMNQALARITKFHFDYTQVSRMDRTAKRLIPFWTFVSRNLPLQIEQMWMRPRAYLQYQSFVRNFGAIPNQFTPDYWLAQGAFTVDQNAATADGNDAPWYLAPDLPFTRVTEPIDALAHGDIGKALLSDVNPLFAAPIEAYAAHRKFYTGAPIEGYGEAHGAMSWLEPIFNLLGQTETGGTSGNTLVSESAMHMARTLNPILNLAERLTSEGDDNSVRTGRRDETLYRALGAPVYQLTPQVRDSTRRTRMNARRRAASTQAELARS